MRREWLESTQDLLEAFFRHSRRFRTVGALQDTLEQPVLVLCSTEPAEELTGLGYVQFL
jgi:hypothetical protein